jgi:transposase
MREVSADAAFGSYENFEAVDAIGAMPYFDFKSNTTADAGGVFRKMFHLYNLNRDEYLNHYHKRSNVESTASMVKAKFGDHLRSKTDVAMANEALAKIMCHNICCLIQSMFELGIAATFWGEDEGEPVEAPKVETTDEMIEAWAWV